VKLSLVTAADIADLADLHAAAFDIAWDASAFYDVLAGPGVFGYLAREGDPVGLVLCRTAADELEVLTLAVAPAARRAGVGKAMLAAALATGRTIGAQQAFLEVAVDNSEAVGLYAGLGFRRAGVRKAYYDRGEAGRIDALVMRLDLEAPTA
jgi:ribosomal-protein-alanine N-acetyltransferase